MKTNFRVTMFYAVWAFMFAYLVQAGDQSIVNFSISCSETIPYRNNRNVLDTNITLDNAISYEANLQSMLSPTRSPSNPVNLELAIKPAIFSGKIYNYIRLDSAIKSYDPYDGILLHEAVWPIHLSDHLPRNRSRIDDEINIFNWPANQPYLRCVTNLISVVPSSKIVIPDRINFKAQIRYNCDDILNMSEVTECSLAIGESCEIYIHTFYGDRDVPTHTRREIILIDIAINPVTNEQALFFNYIDHVWMRKLTSDFSGNIDWVFGESLYIKK